MLDLYNSLTQNKEPFAPVAGPRVGVYSCGPTVYARQHLGNMRPYVFADTLRRTLEHFGYRVNHVINVTDVGHLTSDADSGQDKLEARARKLGSSATAIAHRYTRLFQRDLVRLGVHPPEVWAFASAHIAEQLELIQNLERCGFTYVTADGVYFDSSKSARLGHLCRHAPAIGRPQARVVGRHDKRLSTDFALWKFPRPDERRQMEWPSPWGIGFPGWHTECCAMASKYLGTSIDIHTGGVDHIPVHHENEILQAEALAPDRRWVRTWMHSEWVMFEGAKLAKSTGAAANLDHVVDCNLEPLAYRLWLLGAHYKSRLHFSWQSLAATAEVLTRLRARARPLLDQGRASRPALGSEHPLLEEFNRAIADDLDTPRALAVLFRLLAMDQVDPATRTSALLAMDRVLGLDLGRAAVLPNQDPHILKLVSARERARAGRDFEMADRLRVELEALGYHVEDAPEGPRLKLVPVLRHGS